MLTRTETDATDCRVKTIANVYTFFTICCFSPRRRSLLEMILIVQLVKGHFYFKFFVLSSL